MNEPPRYTPTRRQVEFRALAEVAWTFGHTSLSALVRISRGEPLCAEVKDESGEVVREAQRAPMDQPLSIREWRHWEKEAGFREWWTEAFPEADGPTRTDLAVAEGVFWNQMLRGLRVGHPDAMKLYAGIKAAADKAGASAGSLDEHFEEPDDVENGWTAGEGAH